MQKRSFSNLLKKIAQSGEQTVYGSIRGGLPAENGGDCTNTKTCSGVNGGNCTNTATANCSASTNNGTACQNQGACFTF